MNARRTVFAVAAALLIGVFAIQSAVALTPKPYSTYLSQARPVLAQWHNAIEGWRGHNFLLEPNDSNSANAAQLEALLDQWWPALENERGFHFLLEPTATNLDTTVELHSLLNQWQNATDAWHGGHIVLEPPGPYTAFTPKKTGKGKFKPKHSETAIGQHRTLSIDWTVPKPSNWHDLETIELRVCEGANGVLSLRWDELTNQVTLLDPKSGRRLDSGTLGDVAFLNSHTAKLFLNPSSATAAGPAARKVTLKLVVAFKATTRGSECEVELAASDDFGNSDKFKRAGSLAVAD
jgi:hypothetical protein